jgi:hypothetical protein
MPQDKGIEPSRLRRSRCAAHTASDFRGFCSFEAWRLRLPCVPGEQIRRPRLSTAEAVSGMSVWADALTQFTQPQESNPQRRRPVAPPASAAD